MSFSILSPVFYLIPILQPAYPTPANEPGSGEGLIISASIIVIIIMTGILLHSNKPPHQNVDNG